MATKLTIDEIESAVLNHLDDNYRKSGVEESVWFNTEITERIHVIGYTPHLKVVLLHPTGSPHADRTVELRDYYGEIMEV